MDLAVFGFPEWTGHFFASGVVNGWRVSLASVRIGSLTVRNVDAFVTDNDTLDVGLLGMSFLGRVDMHRQGSTLVLRRRR